MTANWAVTRAPIDSTSLFTSFSRSGLDLSVFRPSSVKVLSMIYVAISNPLQLEAGYHLDQQ